MATKTRKSSKNAVADAVMVEMDGIVLNGETRRAQRRAIKQATARADNIAAMAEVVKSLRGDFWQVEYDIRDISGLPNPSHWLKALAIRLSLSCWILPQASFESKHVVDWMAELRANGCKVRTIKYHPDQLENIRNIAIECLEEEVKRFHGELIGGIADADKALKTFVAENPDVSWDRLQAAENEHDDSVKKYVRTAIHYLNAAIDAAEKFDITMEVNDLLFSHRDIIASKAAVLNASLAAHKRKQLPFTF